MRKGLLTTLLILVLAFGASAQDGMKPAIYAGGGISMPMGDFGDLWKMGIGFGGGVGIKINPTFAVVGKVFYNTFGMDVEGIEGGDFNALSFVADIHFYPMKDETGEMAFAPYIIGGVGMTSAKQTEITAPAGAETPESESATDLTFGFGGGFEYEMSPTMAFWVEAKYMIISTEGSSTSHVPIRAGIKFNLGQ